MSRDLVAATVPPGPGVVWIYLQELDQPGEPIEAFASCLSEDERRRAERFYRPRDGRRFTVARGMLRRRLSGILGLEPGAVQFSYSAHGKPRLAPGPGQDTPLQFNLAHSDHLAILAVTVGDPVGVDIERIRPVKSLEGIVAKHFSPAEREAFRRLPDLQRLESFFHVWTRKEAIVKAIGTGLTLPLTSFDVALQPRPSCALLGMRHPNHAAEPWSLHALDAPQGFCAAVAIGRCEPVRILYL